MLDWLTADFTRKSRQWHWRFTGDPPGKLVLLMVDCSSSMVRSGALAVAKAMALALMEKAYQARHQIALIEFGGVGANLRVSPQRASWDNSAWVDLLSGGGGTPLCEATVLANSVLRNSKCAHKQLWLFTDGRVRDWPPAPEFTQSIQVVDMEMEAPHLRLQRARTLASEWHANLVALPE